LLVAHYYDELGAGEPPAEVLAELARHDWPGNVRELRAAVERAVLLGDPGLVDPAGGQPASAGDGVSFRVAKERAIAQWEREYLRALIARHQGNISRAARAVRMDRNHLRELLVRYDIRAEDG
jgi:DNA-binding NtrC family response regulator